MSNKNLKPFSFAVLALVGESGAGPHDIVRMMRGGGREYWATSESHFYAEPKRLAELGYLRAESTPGQTRARTHYMLTEAGREALRDWCRLPAPFPRIQSEPIIRVLSGDLLADDPALLASLAHLRAELDEMDADLDANERTAGTLPHRERYLRLVHKFGRGLVALHREWLDEVDAELG